MECYEIEKLLIDYIDGQLSPAARENVGSHLQSCAGCRQALEEYKTLLTAINAEKEIKPRPVLREKFDTMLQSELNIDATTRMLKDAKEKKVIAMKKPSLALRIAAGVLLLAAGVVIGATLIPRSSSSNSNPQMADLQKEVKEIKETLMFTLLDDESASERIKAVNYVEKMNDPDQKVIDALFATMNEDKNVNVRLAALYSITKFVNRRGVKDSLVTSLQKQKEPIMQIVLINMLTEQKEKKAIGPLKEILMDKTTSKPVKEIAEKGLQIL